MPRKFLKRYLPHPVQVRDHKQLRMFGRLLHQPDLWHLNRRSVSGAFAVGLFAAFVPIPFQMVLAAAAAIAARVNLPLSVALVWITNPITMTPLFYFAYLVGAFVLGTQAQHVEFEMSLRWFVSELDAIWQPFLLGCFLTGATSAVLGYYTVRLVWRWYVVRQLRRKRARRLVVRSPTPPVPRSSNADEHSRFAASGGARKPRAGFTES
jgi:uncharacterized protein (DUF2062 family)